MTEKEAILHEIQKQLKGSLKIVGLKLSDFNPELCPARVGTECHYGPQIEVEFEQGGYVENRVTWRDFGSPPCRACMIGLELYERREK